MKMTLSNLAKLIVKAYKEKGRIHIYDNGFQLCPDEKRKPGRYKKQNGEYDRISLDFNNKKGILVGVKSIHCNNSNMISDYYVFQDGDVASIPYKDCKKCNYHIPRKKNKKAFPECLLKL